MSVSVEVGAFFPSIPSVVLTTLATLRLQADIVRLLATPFPSMGLAATGHSRLLSLPSVQRMGWEGTPPTPRSRELQEPLDGTRLATLFKP